ncbi:hypothetical protein C0995_014773 [Termitomyces sp. Mi166|nr:hypothetical protein C0995_014773 [Termitomyces sp. Mi166\
MYVEEDKNGASATFDNIADYIESQNVNDLEQLFKDYAVQENIDILHRVVNEAKERKAQGEVNKDVWRENLNPREAVSARTIPIIESEVKRLREALAEVWLALDVYLSFLRSHQIQEENRSLQTQIEENVTAVVNTKKTAKQLLDKLDRVYDDWQNLPTEQIEAWTVQTMESLKPGPPP